VQGAAGISLSPLPEGDPIALPQLPFAARHRIE